MEIKTEKMCWSLIIDSCWALINICLPNAFVIPSRVFCLPFRGDKYRFRKVLKQIFRTDRHIYALARDKLRVENQQRV